MSRKWMENFIKINTFEISFILTLMIWFIMNAIRNILYISAVTFSGLPGNGVEVRGQFEDQLNSDIVCLIQTKKKIEKKNHSNFVPTFHIRNIIEKWLISCNTKMIMQSWTVLHHSFECIRFYCCFKWKNKKKTRRMIMTHLRNWKSFRRNNNNWGIILLNRQNIYVINGIQRMHAIQCLVFGPFSSSLISDSNENEKNKFKIHARSYLDDNVPLFNWNSTWYCSFFHFVSFAFS